MRDAVKDNCGATTTPSRDLDIPDCPARAWLNPTPITSTASIPTPNGGGSGSGVTLLATWAEARLDRGPTLGNVTHECRAVWNSSWDTDPAMYDDRTWLDSPYVVPGSATIYALAHMEYHGWSDVTPHNCANSSNPEPQYCWYNAVVLLKSVDGGQSFQHALPPPQHLVAAAPYRYSPTTPALGYGDMSNMLRGPDGLIYAFIHARRDVGAVRAGACLMRTAEAQLGDPRSWRAWDGQAFNISFVNPYTQAVPDPARHACTPLATMPFLPLAVAYNTYYRRYMATGEGPLLLANGTRILAFQFALSEDLIHWAAPVLIRPMLHSPQVSDNYAAVLDPSAVSPAQPNFDIVGRASGFLYFTRSTQCAALPFRCRSLFRQSIVFG